MSQQDNMQKNEMIVIAKVGATYCLKGQLKLFVLSDSIKTALSYGQWYIKKVSDRNWFPLTGETISPVGTKLIIKFSDANVKEIAAKYTNALLAVPRSTLKDTDEDEYYWADLTGMQVVNIEGYSFGTVYNILDTGANDVLCCKQNAQSYLIPFITNNIIKVSKDNKIITVDWQYDY